jgi:hypothetical protein
MAAKSVAGGSEMAEQKRGWIQPGISVGNIANAIIVLLALGAGWARMEAALGDHDRRIDDLETADKSLTSDRMREARDMADMKADMRWIRSTLERLERDLKRGE